MRPVLRPVLSKNKKRKGGTRMNTESTVNTETISEQIFWKNALLCVVGILLCLAMLCTTTLAWFKGNERASSSLPSGCFPLEITVARLPETDFGIAYTVEPTRTNENSGAHYYKLPKGTYQVTLDLGTTASAKGFCLVDLGGEQLTTDAIVGENTTYQDGFALTSPYIFTIVITEDDTALSLHPRWGMSASPNLLPDT